MALGSSRISNAGSGIGPVRTARVALAAGQTAEGFGSSRSTPVRAGSLDFGPVPRERPRNAGLRCVAMPSRRHGHRQIAVEIERLRHIADGPGTATLEANLSRSGASGREANGPAKSCLRRWHRRCSARHRLDPEADVFQDLCAADRAIRRQTRWQGQSCCLLAGGVDGLGERIEVLAHLDFEFVCRIGAA